MTWWMTTLASVAYGVGYLVTARLVAGHVAWKQAATWGHYYDVDGGNWTAGYIAGLGVGWMWPLLLVARVVLRYRLVSFERLAIGAERAALDRCREERIRKLEREAGIR